MEWNMEGMAEKLEQLSQSAAQGELTVGYTHWGDIRLDVYGGDGSTKVNGKPITNVVPYAQISHHDAEFISALWNLYRVGKLIVTE